jgi:hypothetical protein
MSIMEASDLDVLEPVDYLVVEFPAAKANFSGGMATQLGSLVDRELIRVLDLLLLRKDMDGSVEVAELNELAAVDVGGLLALEDEGAAVPASRLPAPAARRRSGGVRGCPRRAAAATIGHRNASQCPDGAKRTQFAYIEPVRMARES